MQDSWTGPPASRPSSANYIEKRVKGDTGKLLVNDFSTTDHVSQTASQIVLMDAMKYYFVYTMRFDCGIPSVTLHGTLADWERLQEKARALRALRIGRNWWLDNWTRFWRSWWRRTGGTWTETGGAG